MVGMLFFLVLCGVALRVIYGLHRPHFWLFCALVVLIGLPLVLGMLLLAPVVNPVH